MEKKLKNGCILREIKPGIVEAYYPNGNYFGRFGSFQSAADYLNDFSMKNGQLLRTDSYENGRQKAKQEIMNRFPVLNGSPGSGKKGHTTPSFKNFNLDNFDDSDDTNIPNIISKKESKKKISAAMAEMKSNLTQEDQKAMKKILADLKRK